VTLTYGKLDDINNADTDGSYSKIAGSIEKAIAFNPEYSLTTSLRFQKALNNKNLDGSEDFSLGGAYGVRAFPDGEHSAENGYIFGAELFYALPSVEGINHKASIFADTGYAKMENDNGTLQSRQLSDIGIGYQASYKDFFAKAQVARVIGGEKSTTEDEDSTRVLVQIGWIY
jgi:hemolysin activation/secretion protein